MSFNKEMETVFFPGRYLISGRKSLCALDRENGLITSALKIVTDAAGATVTTLQEIF